MRRVGAEQQTDPPGVGVTGTLMKRYERIADLFGRPRRERREPPDDVPVERNAEDIFIEQVGEERRKADAQPTGNMRIEGSRCKARLRRISGWILSWCDGIYARARF